MRCIFIYLILKRLPVNTKKTYKYTSELLARYVSDKENLTMKSLILAQDER